MGLVNLALTLSWAHILLIFIQSLTQATCLSWHSRQEITSGALIKSIRRSCGNRASFCCITISLGGLGSQFAGLLGDLNLIVKNRVCIPLSTESSPGHSLLGHLRLHFYSLKLLPRLIFPKILFNGKRKIVVAYNLWLELLAQQHSFVLLNQSPQKCNILHTLHLWWLLWFVLNYRFHWFEYQG